MNTTRKSTGLAFITGLLLASSLFAQGSRKQAAGQSGEQYWLKFEKELGLQTRYSVDMDMQTMGMNMPSKVYRTDGKTRSEMTVPILNMRMVALQLPVNGKTVNYSLFPDKKKYCINPEDAAADAAAAAPKVKMEELGTELFEGAACKKRRMTVTMADGTVSEMTLLLSPAQKGMPVKIDSQAKLVAEPGEEPLVVTAVILFKNYQFGAPDASLFAIPNDYTQAKNMEEIMMGGGGLFGMPRQPSDGGATLPPEAQAALRQAQADAAKEAKANGTKDAAAQEGLRQGLQGLRNLLGR